MDARFMTAEKAAEHIGCTTGRVYQLFREGELVGERLHARAIVLDRNSVEEYALRPQPTGRPRSVKPAPRTISENS